jgi:hypothetical protein
MGIVTKRIKWNGALEQEGIDVLLNKGGMIVSPTKVGYIIMTSDADGLKRRFTAKQSSVLLTSLVLFSAVLWNRWAS